ncbi:MAG: radical SAM protein, partial [Phycisphaerae bacterium]
IKGRAASAGEVVARAVRMRPFFDHSAGGVTLTGGEVTGQVAFAEAVLAGCRNERIHTAIETCGACDWPELERLAGLADLVLYDLKLMDDAEHRRRTGVSNAPILANARRLAGGDAAVEFRGPLVPGITDTQDNLGGIFAFLREVDLPRVTLLPFNPSAGAKYEWLGRACEIDAEPQDEGRLAALREMAAAAGVEAAIG